MNKVAKGAAYPKWLERIRAELDETQEKYCANDPDGKYEIYEDDSGDFELTRTPPEREYEWMYEIDTDNEIFYGELP